jgi:2'-5' RNA ligase
MRLFLCTFLDADTQACYRRLMADVARRCEGRMRGVPADSVHLTYAFLADVDEGRLAAVIQSADAVAGRFGPAPIRLGPPRVLTVGAEARLVMADVVAGGEALARLVEDLRAELERRLPGVMLARGQQPHATLARFRRGTRTRAAAPVTAMLDSMAATERACTVASIQVVSSELTPEGPRYVTTASVPLRGLAHA